jgi:hypothetical protein
MEITSLYYKIRYQVIFILIFTLLASPSCRQSKKDSVLNDSISTKGVIVVDNKIDQKVDVFIDGDLFTSYLYRQDLEKPVLFPVTTASGTIVTRGYPLQPREGERVDHPHQVGVWFNYGDVNGFDFWNNSFNIPAGEKIKYGKIVHRQVKRAISKDKTGLLEVRMDWMVQHDPLLPAVPLLTEETTFEFTGGTKTRTIDQSITLTANNEDVIFKDNKEGLFAIRVDRAFEYPSEEPLVYTDAQGNPSEVQVLNNEGVNGHYRNSKGIEGIDVWAKRADWVSLSATKNGEDISIVIFDHPANPGYPAYWHARGYGLFSVNNLGQKIFSDGKEELNFTLKKGESVTFRYRLYITSGYKATDEELNKQFQEFAEKK